MIAFRVIFRVSLSTKALEFMLLDASRCNEYKDNNLDNETSNTRTNLEEMIKHYCKIAKDTHSAEIKINEEQKTKHKNKHKSNEELW